MGANLYINVNNVFNIRYFNVPGGYLSTLRFPWTAPSGNDKYGIWDKYYINQYGAGDDYVKWAMPKREIYLGIRYQF